MPHLRGYICGRRAVHEGEGSARKQADGAHMALQMHRLVVFIFLFFFGDF